MKDTDTTTRQKIHGRRCPHRLAPRLPCPGRLLAVPAAPEAPQGTSPHRYCCNGPGAHEFETRDLLARSGAAPSAQRLAPSGA